jgi:hypothetical protein
MKKFYQITMSRRPGGFDQYLDDVRTLVVRSIQVCVLIVFYRILIWSGFERSIPAFTAEGGEYFWRKPGTSLHLSQRSICVFLSGRILVFAFQATGCKRHRAVFATERPRRADLHEYAH